MAPTDWSDARTEITAALMVLGSSMSYTEIVKSISDGVTVWKKGDKVQGSLITRKQDGWELESTLPKENSLSEHVKNIIQCVYPNLLTIARDSVKLSAAVYMYGLDRPSLRIDAEAIRKLAELGAELDIDLYNFP
jgi:hypothetical protein